MSDSAGVIISDVERTIYHNTLAQLNERNCYPPTLEELFCIVWQRVRYESGDIWPRKFEFVVSDGAGLCLVQHRRPDTGALCNLVVARRFEVTDKRERSPANDINKLTAELRKFDTRIQCTIDECNSDHAIFSFESACSAVFVLIHEGGQRMKIGVYDNNNSNNGRNVATPQDEGYPGTFWVNLYLAILLLPSGERTLASAIDARLTREEWNSIVTTVGTVDSVKLLPISDGDADYVQGELRKVETGLKRAHSVVQKRFNRV